MFSLHRALALIGIGISAALPAVTFGQVGLIAGPHGTLPTTGAGEGPIYDYELAAMIAAKIPECCKKLLIFTQCYGGDFLDDFAGDPNTAAASANEPGKPSYYGGYHRGAAKGLKPGAGTTAAGVHGAGVAGKDPRETPQTGGGLPLGGFPMDPPAPGSDVESRHVLVYAGLPEGLDNQDKTDIQNNFAGQPNTSVRTCGSTGPGSGWQQPATHAGLQASLDAIAAEIAASPHPCKEQFILFVTDHGDLHNCTFTNTQCNPNTTVITPVSTFHGVDALPWLETTDNVTAVSIFLPIGLSGVMWPNNQPLFNPGNWTVMLQWPGHTMQLTQFTEQHVDLGDGIIGNRMLEGVRLSFPIPEQIFISSFFDVFYSVQVGVRNNTARPWLMSSVGLDSGEIRRPGDGEHEPCPADFNDDGFLDFFDIDAFVNCFEGLGCPPGKTADYNGDGFVDFFDSDAYITDFELGC